MLKLIVANLVNNVWTYKSIRIILQYLQEQTASVV
jgi:hypothetical protein